jgi:two-component system response regulator YesN
MALLNYREDLKNFGHTIGLEAPYKELNLYYRPPKWVMPLHRHPFFQFLLVLQGELIIKTELRQDILTKGMASLIPPEIPHRLETRKGYRQFGINTSPEASKDDSLLRILKLNVTSPEALNMSNLMDLIPEIEDCCRLQTILSIQKIRNRLEYMFLTCVDTLKKQSGDQGFKEKITDYLRENISESLTLDCISRHFSLSPSHVERLAYLDFGCGALRLFHRLKIDRARVLLHTSDMTVSQIAAHLGYEDQSYFSRYFKRFTGLSPTAYKKANYNKE